MNTILVIRLSNTDATNNTLAAALEGTYSNLSKLYPIEKPGGKISVLFTNKTFEQISTIVRDSDCKDNCIIVDADPKNPQTILILSTELQLNNPIQVQSEIDRLLNIRRKGGTLTADEEALLVKLLS